MAEVFKTQKKQIAAYAVLLMSYALFVGVVIYKKGAGIGVLILSLLALPVMYHLLLLIRREIRFEHKGISIKGAFSKNFLSFSDIKEAVIPRRGFLAITTKDKVFILDDTISNFKEMVIKLFEKLPEDKRPKNWKEIIEQLPKEKGIPLLPLATIGILLFLALKVFIGA